jgi:hypothetical protein
LISAVGYANFGGTWKNSKQRVKETYTDYSVVEDSDKTYHLSGLDGVRLRVSIRVIMKYGVLITPTSARQAEQPRSEIAQILESKGPAN